MEIKERISALRTRANAVILAHNYQPPDIQDIADFTGDSLQLSRKAAETDADVIVFCGVDFMAETAKVLSPGKKVILPAPDATCPMAEMITPSDLEKLKEQHPGAPVVSYVNTTAEVKAHSDICCTSSNAVKIAASLRENKIIFTPDRNLAHYVSTQVQKEIVPWPGYCPVHDSMSPEDVERKRKDHPDAVFMAHPECRPAVLEQADHVASTGQMFDVARSEKAGKFIIGTEAGMVYALQKAMPEKEFIPLSSFSLCANMKKITLDRLVRSLEEQQPEITLPEDVVSAAYLSLKRMLDIV
jgi:quinolinate synthase